jgi:hypothetical protein
VTETFPNCGKVVSRRRRAIVEAFHVALLGMSPRNGFGT